MKNKTGVLEEKDYESIRGALGYLLAGLEGNTDGHKINSITVQQTDLSDFRVVVRAQERDGTELGVYVVAFSNGREPATALLHAEAGYRENVTRWSPDRFAEGASGNGTPKIKQARLRISD
jgi:hypothetical protein